MKLAMLGLGQAGGKIVDRFLAYDARTDAGYVGWALSTNTALAHPVPFSTAP
jgi:cell division GTPase FtsZ